MSPNLSSLRKVLDLLLAMSIPLGVGYIGAFNAHRQFMQIFLQATMQAGPDGARAGEADPRRLPHPLFDIAIECGS
jgi:hypothetical protein